jgi:hypothetical protein
MGEYFLLQNWSLQIAKCKLNKHNVLCNLHFAFFILQWQQKMPLVGEPAACGLSSARCSIEESCELLAADGMLQFFDRFGLDLPNAFAGDFEDASHLFKRVGVAIPQAVAQADDLPFAVGERFKQLFDAFAK